MRGTTILLLCGLFLALSEASPKHRRGACGADGSLLSKLGCMTPAVADNSTNEAQYNSTEEMRLNDTAEMVKINETVAEKSTELLKARVKRETTSPFTQKPWNPFSSNGSGFALQSEDEEKATKEERRLNDTAEMLKVNETIAEQATQQPKTREKRTPDIQSGWNPFSSGGSAFASQSENEENTTTEERRLNETTESKVNETVTEQPTQLPKTTTAKVRTTTVFVWHPFGSGKDGAHFASQSEKEAEATV